MFSHASLFLLCCSHIWASRLHPFSAACIEKPIQKIPPFLFILLAVPAMQCSWLNTCACLLQLLLSSLLCCSWKTCCSFCSSPKVLPCLLACLLALKSRREPHVDSGAVQASQVSCYKHLSHCPHLIFISVFIFSHFSISFYWLCIYIYVTLIFCSQLAKHAMGVVSWIASTVNLKVDYFEARNYTQVNGNKKIPP